MKFPLILALVFLHMVAGQYYPQPNIPYGCHATQCVVRGLGSQCEHNEARFHWSLCNAFTRRDICCPRKVSLPGRHFGQLGY